MRSEQLIKQFNKQYNRDIYPRYMSKDQALIQWLMDEKRFTRAGCYEGAMYVINKLKS